MYQQSRVSHSSCLQHPVPVWPDRLLVRHLSLVRCWRLLQLQQRRQQRLAATIQQVLALVVVFLFARLKVSHLHPD